ncbi:MAG: hypothetical protein AAFN92_19475, partial [Bacteroidota bacterium]
MLKHLLLLPCLLFTVLQAQPDAYHTQLTEWLGTQYTLTGATYPYSDTEAENFARFSSYNASTVFVDAADDQDFTRVARVRVARAQTNRWDSGWTGTNTQAIPMGDKILWVIYLRAAGGEDATGKVALFAER